MKTNLAIISIAFCFLGGIQCITFDQFNSLKETYITEKEMATATVFVTENFVTKNRFCFMMLLREMVVSETVFGYQAYRNPFLVSLYLLNNEMFHTHYDAILNVLKDLKNWNTFTKSKNLEQSIRTLIEDGEQYNMWHMDKGAATYREDDSFHLGITEEFSVAETCLDLYNTLSADSTLVQNIMERSLPEAIDARIKLLRSIPYLMYKNAKYSKLMKYTNGMEYYQVDKQSNWDFMRAGNSVFPELFPKSPLDKDIEFQNLLSIVLDFYKMKIYSFVYHSYYLLGMVVDKDEHKVFKNKEEAVLTYLTVTDKIIKCVDSMVLRFNKLRSYNEILSKTENKLEVDWPRLQAFYANIRTKVKNEEGPIFGELPSVLKKTNNDYEDIGELDLYPSLIMYYPKNRLFKEKIDKSVSFKRLMNLQAWASILPNNMDASITVIESVDKYSRLQMNKNHF